MLGRFFVSFTSNFKSPTEYLEVFFYVLVINSSWEISMAFSPYRFLFMFLLGKVYL